MTNSERSGLYARIRKYPSATFGVGASDDEVALVEAALGVRLPAAFVAFLHEFGWGGAGDLELFGCGKDVPPYLDLVRLTISERMEARPALPHYLVPIANDGMGISTAWTLPVGQLTHQSSTGITRRVAHNSRKS